MEVLHLIVLIAHVIVACLLLGMAFVGLVISSRRELPAGSIPFLRVLPKFAKPLSILQLLLGISLVALEPENFLHNPLIWAKLVLYIASGIVGGALVEKRLAQTDKPTAEQAAAIRQAWLLLFVIVITIVILGVIAAETAK